MKIRISAPPNDPPIIATVNIKMKRPSFKHWQIAGAAFVSESGQWKDWKNGYEYRLDRRPANIGGDQLHIRGRTGDWAFRSDGSPSEPNKYTSAVKLFARRADARSRLRVVVKILWLVACRSLRLASLVVDRVGQRLVFALFGKTLIETGQVQLAVDQVIHGMFDGAGEELPLQVNSKKARAGVYVFVTRHIGLQNLIFHSTLIFVLVQCNMRE